MASLNIRTVAAALAGLVAIVDAGASGSGKTTRYWDCCKPSCGVPGKASAISAPVGSCDINDQPLSDPNAHSGCDGGNAFMCSNQTPWAIDDNNAYGFAAVNIAGGSESSWCCACYKLTFTSTAIAGKTMIVQAVNTGGDLGSNQFDLALPGSGVGIFNGCTAEWNAPPGGWGAQYGGMTANQCSTLPAALQPGCNFRFGWMMGADNPTVDFEQVACPAELTSRSGCKRTDDGSLGGGNSSPSSYPAGSSTASSSMSTRTSASSSASGSAASSSSASQSASSSASRSAHSYGAASSSSPFSSASSSSKSASSSASHSTTSTSASASPSTSRSASSTSQSQGAACPLPESSSTTGGQTQSSAKGYPSGNSGPSSTSSQTHTSTGVSSPGNGSAGTGTSYGGSGSGSGAALYQQCGGTGWTGPTNCAQGSCKVMNPYYSQCLQ